MPLKILFFIKKIFPDFIRIKATIQNLITHQLTLKTDKAASEHPVFRLYVEFETDDPDAGAT
jgi:hypothetical protein